MQQESIAFHITDRCQLNCDHCLRDPGLKALDLEVDLIADILDQAKDLYNISHVALTGGEPTLHPGFIEIIDAIVDRHMTWHVVTNAHDFQRTIASLDARPSRLDALTAFNFSLDGATEEIHDGIREEGSFRNLMRAVTLCESRGIGFLLQMCVNARNIHQVDEMAILASHLGARSLAYAVIQPTGTFLDRSLYLPASVLAALRDQIVRLGSAMKIEISLSNGAPQESPFFECDPYRHRTLHVDTRGHLNLCCQHSGIPSSDPAMESLGDLHEITLAEGRRAMVERVSAMQTARLEAIEAGPLSDWDRSPCNWCLKQHGMPHWVENGVGGPTASRKRWRGAWTPGYKASHRAAADDDPAADAVETTDSD